MRPSGAVVDVLAADPELAGGLDRGQAEAARQACVARRISLAPGPWEQPRIPAGARGGIGLLVVEGLVVRRFTLEHRSAAELLGPGDLLRPWDYDGHDWLLPVATDWRVLARTEVAVLDSAWVRRIAAYPSITGALVGRALRRSRWLSDAMAIAQQPRLELRLWMVLWTLADRYGVVSPAGVELRIELTHEILGYLTAARRPSVSTALQRLADDGLVRRTARGWVLGGAPPDDAWSAAA